MTLDRQPAAAAERRLAERAIHVISPTRTTAPSRIHSQMRPELDSLLGAGELVGCAVGVAALGLGDGLALGLGDGLALGLGDGLALGVGDGLALWVGDGLALWPGEKEMLRLGARLAIAFLAPLPHPAAMPPTTRMAARTERARVRRRMPEPSRALYL
jgi:hypothetical protein